MIFGRSFVKIYYSTRNASFKGIRRVDSILIQVIRFPLNGFIALCTCRFLWERNGKWKRLTGRKRKSSGRRFEKRDRKKEVKLQGMVTRSVYQRFNHRGITLKCARQGNIERFLFIILLLNLLINYHFFFPESF